MLKWFKEQSTTVKWMLVIILLLVLGILTRWDYISKEVTESFRSRFTQEEAR